MPKEKENSKKKKKEVISQSLISTTWHNNESVRHSENSLGIINELNEFLMFPPSPSPFYSFLFQD